MDHTNGIESFWAMQKRGSHGACHHMSQKHLYRDVIKFAGQHNVRELHTAGPMDTLASRMKGKRLTDQRPLGK